MDQQTTQPAAKGGLWTKLVLIVLAGIIGYFIGRGNLSNPSPSSDLTANTANTAGTKSATLGENGTMNKEEGTGESMAKTETSNMQSPFPAPAPTPPTVSPSVSTGAMMDENTIAVANQAAGESVTIALTLSENVWVAIHDSVNGKPGNILGARRYFKGGPVDPVVLLRATQAGASYIAMMHHDDGDTTFSFKGGDSPLLGKDGNPIMAVFKAQ